MKAFTRTMILGLATLSIAATVSAAEAPTSDIAALEDSRAAVAWEARNAKGVDKLRLLQKQRYLQSLIESLERGGRVDPSEVDRALNRSR